MSDRFDSFRIRDDSYSETRATIQRQHLQKLEDSQRSPAKQRDEAAALRRLPARGRHQVGELAVLDARLELVGDLIIGFVVVVCDVALVQDNTYIVP